MKPMTMLGVVLILLGVVALVYQGVTYTSRDTVIDIGPLHATADRQKTLPLSPVLGITALGADFADAQRRAYEAVAMIHFENAYFRRDIASRAVNAGCVPTTSGGRT